jgi:rhodanese-related sulfurtransferase
MTKQIEADTLRAWLEAQQPVTVLDIRTDEDRAQWAIPGSLHINAYEAKGRRADDSASARGDCAGRHW